MVREDGKSAERQGPAGPVAAADDAWEAARAAGIDLSLVEANLRKTPEARLRAHAGALALARALREAMERRNA